jgi:hyaluronate lyase
MLIEDEISRDLIMKYLEPFRIICYYPDGMSGNKLMMSYNVIFASILERDAVRLVQAKELLYDEFFYQDRPEDPTVMRIGDGGAYTDGSYVQHHNIAYTGVYGMTMIQNISSILYITNGTVFDLNKDRVSILFEWIFNNYNSVIYEGHYMPSLIGRNINGTSSKGVSDTDVTINLINEIIVASTYAPAEWKGKLISLIKYYFNLFDGINFAMKAPISLIDYCNEIYADDTIVPWTQPIETKLYPIMARVLHSGPKYGVSISLSSTYIGKYESFGTTNNAGWYHGDGMIYIHAHDYDFDENFFWWANPYLMPGVTANTAERVAKSVSSPTMVNYSPFVGGVSQGKYGIVGYVFGNADSVFRSGTYKEEKDAKLRANKSYFFFDNEVVCIGTGINDFSDDDVITVVENRYWSDSDVLYIDGEVMSSPATAQTTISARTMHFSNMGGYVFLHSDKNYDGASITYAKKTNAVNSLIENSQINLDHVRKVKKDFLEIVINHGKGDGNVENNKYFYAYLPESTATETQTYSANPDVEPLTYLDDIHAVIEKDLGIVAANIFVEGSTKSVSVDSEFHGYTNVRSISADGPCSVMISKNEAGETVITVSDPTQLYRQNNIYIEIEGVSQVVSADSRITATANGGYVNIRVNTEGANGQSLTLIVK